MPALARSDPGHPARRAGRPGDQRVIGVGDHMAVGGAAQRLPPAPGHQPDLGRPVHLVPAQVQQRDDAGAGDLDHRGQVPLVNFEDPERGVRGPSERGSKPGRHVRTERVGRDLLAERPERRGDQPGRGGLPVRPGHQHDLAAGGEQPEQVRLHPQADRAADHGAVTAPGQPRHSSRGTGDRGGQARPERKLPHGRRCYPSKSLAIAAEVISPRGPTRAPRPLPGPRCRR